MSPSQSPQFKLLSDTGGVYAYVWLPQNRHPSTHHLHRRRPPPPSSETQVHFSVVAFLLLLLEVVLLVEVLLMREGQMVGLALLQDIKDISLS